MLILEAMDAEMHGCNIACIEIQNYLTLDNIIVYFLLNKKESSLFRPK